LTRAKLAKAFAARVARQFCRPICDGWPWSPGISGENGCTKVAGL